MLSIKFIECEEPPLTREEEEGVGQAYAELATGMGETFEEAFGDVVKECAAPNSDTIQAMLESEKLSRDVNAKRYSSFREAFNDVIGSTRN